MKKIEGFVYRGETVVTIAAAARFLGYNRASVARLISRGDLVPMGQVGKTQVLSVEDLYDYSPRNGARPIYDANVLRALFPRMGWK